jgi:hypothetical protein
LWFTPATIDQSIIDPFVGVWNNHFGGEYIGLGSYYIMPAFDILLRAVDRNLKNRIIRSELIYKITTGPNGKKYLHLMNTPGSTFDFRNTLFHQGKVWYWYYDVTPENQEECWMYNKDIIKSPADVPLNNIDFIDLNDPSKVWVRRYFIALCKETLGRVRGTFSGKIPIPDADMQMDYDSLLSEAQDEMSTLKEELNGRLDRLSPNNMLERMAEEAKFINDAAKFRALPRPIRMI